MSERVLYTGGCHCGAVRYQVEADLSQTMVCNCSLCSKIGWILALVPKEQFTLLSGEELLTDYQFNKKIIHHRFCQVCGVRSFSLGESAGKEMVAINVRCLDGVEADKLTPMPVDGKSL